MRASHAVVVIGARDRVAMWWCELDTGVNSIMGGERLISSAQLWSLVHQDGPLSEWSLPIWLLLLFVSPEPLPLSPWQLCSHALVPNMLWSVRAPRVLTADPPSLTGQSRGELQEIARDSTRLLEMTWIEQCVY